MALSTFSCLFLLTYTFPLFNEMLGAAGTFWIYGKTCLAGFLFIKLHLPKRKEKAWNKLKMN